MDHTITRRGFVAAGGLTAAAYLRTRGASDRLRIVIVGCGARGTFLLKDCLYFQKEANIEVAGICDLWTRNQDRGAKLVQDAGGREPAKYRHMSEVLERPDVDGVIIATPDFAHSRMLVEAVNAGKDVYCEKPMGNSLEEVQEAYRTVKNSRQVVQIGTQDFSAGNYQAARDFIRSGQLGKVSRVVLENHHNGPRWRGVPDVRLIRAEDTDWRAWLQGHAERPFDPRLYFEFRLYREFCSGIPDQWMCHYVAGTAYIMDDPFPESVVASGGNFLYQDGRETSDTFHATFTYPKGFLVSYGTMFGNAAPTMIRYYGQNGMLEDVDGNYGVTGTGGGAARIQSRFKLRPVSPEHHLRNWFDCIRSRHTPRADVFTGYSHSVAAIMAAQSEVRGRKLYWDPVREAISDTPPVKPAPAAPSIT